LIYYYDRNDKIDGTGEIIEKENGDDGNVDNEIDKIGRI
jgi:hypothetical protein